MMCLLNAIRRLVSDSSFRRNLVFSLVCAAGSGDLLGQAVPSLTGSDVAVLEGDRGTTNLIFILSLSRPSTQTVMVDYATKDVTARVGSDYWASFGVAIFPPGVTNQAVSVSIRCDLQNEPAETFWLMLTNAVNAVLLKDHVVGTILNDDPAPVLAIADTQLLQSETEMRTARFTVQLSPPSGETVTVDYLTSNGTARSGQDFVPVADTLTFVPGTILQTLDIPVSPGKINKPKGSFFVFLTNAVNATISQSTGIATLLNPAWKLADSSPSNIKPRQSANPAGELRQIRAADPGSPVISAFNSAGRQAELTIREALGARNPAAATTLITSSGAEKSEIARTERTQLPIQGPAPASPQTRPEEVPKPADRLALGVPRLSPTLPGAAIGSSLGYASVTGITFTVSAPTNFLHVEQSLKLSLMVTNRGPARADRVVVTNRLPAIASFLAAESSRGSYRLAENSVIFDFGQMAANAVANGSVIFKFSAAGNATNITELGAEEGMGSSEKAVLRFFATNALPVISPISNVVTLVNTPAQPISFEVNDLETSPAQLRLFATCSSPNLLPDANMFFEGIGAERTLFAVPGLDQKGGAVVTITAIDTDGGASSRSFQFTVLRRPALEIGLQDLEMDSPVIDRVQGSEGQFILGFKALAGVNYRVEFCDSMAAPDWKVLTTITGAPGGESIEVIDSVGRQLSRFYRLNAIHPPGAPVRQQLHLSFQADAGQGYAVEYCDSLDRSAWRTLTNIEPATVERFVKITDPNVQGRRFYRLRSR